MTEKASDLHFFVRSPLAELVAYLSTYAQRYTPLLTYAKFAILHIRPTSTWFSAARWTCALWPQRLAP